MFKSKNFTFIAVMTVTTILIIGNWVTPVQANDSGIATPTPTGTPIVQPESTGNHASVEQQAELKGIIQSYFEIRYRALSVSQPYGFRPDGFGDLGVDRQARVEVQFKVQFRIGHVFRLV